MDVRSRRFALFDRISRLGEVRVKDNKVDETTQRFEDTGQNKSIFLSDGDGEVE